MSNDSLRCKVTIKKVKSEILHCKDEIENVDGNKKRETPNVKLEMGNGES